MTIDRGFDEASLEAARLEDGELRFTARRDDSPVAMWWHFAVEGDPRQKLHCVWARTDQVLGGGGLGRAVPVYLTDGRWRRVSPRQVHYRRESHELHFTLPLREPRVEIAYCYPYGLARLETLIERLLNHPEASVREIGESEEGRPFRLIELGHGPFHVWLTARHHAGETPGSYVLEGLLRQAVQEPRLLEGLTLHVAPVMDLDGVAEGRYGKDRLPRDFNRDYTTSPVRPEVAALIQAADWAGQVDLFLDLHAPAPGDCTFLVPVKESLAPVSYWERQWEFGRWLQALAPASCPCRVEDLHRGSMNWSGENLMQTSTCYFQRRYEALSLCLETAYHRSWDGRLVQPRGWQALGRALLRATAVQAGLARPPEVGAIELPPSLIERFKKWWQVHLPVETDFREHPASLEIRAFSDDSYCWVMHKQLFRAMGPQALLAYRLQGAVREVTVTIKGMKGEIPTGTWSSSIIPMAATKGWEQVTVGHGESEYLVMVQVRGLQGKLQVRPGLQD